MASYFFQSNARDDKDSAPHTSAGSTPARSTKAVNQCQEERARQAANSKKTRPHSSTNARHSMQSAGCAACQSTTTQSRTPQMTASTSITSIPSRSTPNSNSTQQASSQATPAATDCAETKTRRRQSEHSQDNGQQQHEPNTRGRGGEIVKPTRWGSTSRVVGLPLPDGRN